MLKQKIKRITCFAKVTKSLQQQTELPVWQKLPNSYKNVTRVTCLATVRKQINKLQNDHMFCKNYNRQLHKTNKRVTWFAKMTKINYNHI